MKVMNLLMTGLVTVSLTACGGGGSGGASTDTNGNSSNTSVIHTSSLVNGDGGGATNKYNNVSGSASLAQLTTNNQQAFVGLFYESEISAENLGSSAKGNDNANATSLVDPTSTALAVKVSSYADQAIYYQLAAAKSGAARDYNETYDCLSSGTYTISGTLDNSTSKGTLEIDFNNCSDSSGGVVFSGKTTVTINQIGSNYWVDYVMAYDGLSAFTLNENWVFTGSQQIIKTITNAAVSSFKVISDVYTLNQNTGRSTLDQTTDEFQVVASTQAVSSVTIGGVLCDYYYGCVNAATRIPFSYAAGELTMSGANNSKLKVYLAQGQLLSQLDEGNGAYQNPVVFEY